MLDAALKALAGGNSVVAAQRLAELELPRGLAQRLEPGHAPSRRLALAIGLASNLDRGQGS